MAEPEKSQEPAQKPVEEMSKIEAATPPVAESKALPNIEAPPLSPAGFVESEPEKIIASAAPAAGKPAIVLPFTISRRMRRNGLLAASVMLAAACGAVIGALAVGSTTQQPPTVRADAAGHEERAAMQKSIAHLSKEVASLKAGIDSSNKGTGTQIGKIADRLDKIEKHDRTADVTGSVAKPAVVAAAPAVEAPLPMPRPNINIVSGWTLHEAGAGSAIVEGRGEYYDVRPGDPLPGLGTVEAIKRENGRWVVVTAKGIIANARPPATASAPPRRRSYYSPYYWPY